MPRWLTRTLARIHALTASGAFHLTHKAHHEARQLGCSATDVRDIVDSLTSADFVENYVKIALRAQCIVVSFHEDEASEPDA